MGLFNIEFGDFGGLDLRDASDEQGGAIDLLNCELDRPGRVRSRDGYVKVTASPGATRYDSVFPVYGPGVSVASTTRSTGTTANLSASGTAWSPTALTASVLVPAAHGGITLVPGTSDYLKATNFGFTVPSTATIVGVVATFTSSGSACVSHSVKIVKGGTVSGTEKASNGGWATTMTFGGSADLWGVGLTPTDVNASTFGVVIEAANYQTKNANTADVVSVTLTVYYQTQASAFLAGAATSRLDLVAVDGTVSATVATASDTVSTYVAFGSPATSATYIANSGTTIRKLAGTTFSTPSGMPKAKFVAIQSPDNRLVAANVNQVPTGSSATAGTSTVVFAGKGAPETWNGTEGGAPANGNQYVYLTPGDNEDIQGATSWRDLVFVFKSTKFFVFYGNSTDNTGLPVFNYRQVTGAGMIAPQAVAVAPDGVYFLDRRGIYFTTGGPPVRVSSILDPLFLGGSVPFFQPGTINPSALTSASMAWYGGRLYLSVALGVSSTNSHTIVFDPASSNWLVWNIPMGAMAASGTQPGVLLFTYASGTNDVGQYAPNAYTTDAGTAITARYRAAQIPLDWRGRNLRSGIHGVDKIVRESTVDGSGTITYTVAPQWTQPASLPTGRTLTLGVAPQVKQARDRTAVKGRMFSWQVSGTAPWSIENVVWGIHGYEPAGVKSDEGN